MDLRRRYSRGFGLLSLVGVCLVAQGCQVGRVRDSEYGDFLDRVYQADYSEHPALDAMAPRRADLAGPHSVEHYIRFALWQNPDIQSARKNVEAAAYRVPQAASLKDPTFGATFFPQSVETAAGAQRLKLSAAQQLPWFGKLGTWAAVAEAETDVARAQLAAAELDVIEQVKRAYYDLYFYSKTIQITEQDRKLMVDLTRIADTKYKTGRASQQDVLCSQLEVSHIDSELIRLRQGRESAQARMARLLHISPDTPVRALDRLEPVQVPNDLERLYQLAIMGRPELHAQLASIERDRRRVKLAHLDYYPDVTAGLSWIDTSSSGLSPVSTGRDAYLLGVSFNVPLYRKRLDAGVREAEARAVSSATRYDSLRDRTLQDVKDLFVTLRSQKELVRLFRQDIIPKADQTLKVSIRAYQVGEVDFLQLVDNWRQLLRFQVSLERLETQLRQTLAALERVVGAPIDVRAQPDVPGPVENVPPPPPNVPPPPPKAAP